MNNVIDYIPTIKVLTFPKPDITKLETQIQYISTATVSLPHASGMHYYRPGGE